jgi:hypothetical protein
VDAVLKGNMSAIDQSHQKKALNWKAYKVHEHQENPPDEKKALIVECSGGEISSCVIAVCSRHVRHQR